MVEAEDIIDMARRVTEKWTHEITIRGEDAMELY